jgi:hypothetical protein
MGWVLMGFAGTIMNDPLAVTLPGGGELRTKKAVILCFAVPIREK